MPQRAICLCSPNMKSRGPASCWTLFVKTFVAMPKRKAELDDCDEFLCSVCGKILASDSGIRSHVKTVHCLSYHRNRPYDDPLGDILDSAVDLNADSNCETTSSTTDDEMEASSSGQSAPTNPGSAFTDGTAAANAVAGTMNGTSAPHFSDDANLAAGISCRAAHHCAAPESGEGCR